MPLMDSAENAAREDKRLQGAGRAGWQLVGCMIPLVMLAVLGLVVLGGMK